MGRKLSRVLILFLIVGLVSTFITQVKAAEIFNDGFEDGLPGDWDGTTGSPSINQTIVHCGSNSCMADASGEYVYEGIDESTLYVRYYGYLDALPPGAGNHITVLMIEQSGNLALELAVYNNAGTVQWRMRHVDGWGTGTTYTDVTDPYEDDWMCIQAHIYVHDTAGNVTVWIDGTLETSVGSLDTNNRGNVDRVEVGSIVDYYAVTSYFDCAVFNDASFIGCEAEGVDVTFILPETLSFTSTLTVGKELAFLSVETVSFTSSLTTQRSIIAFLSETVSFSDGASRGIEKTIMLLETINITDGLTTVIEAGIDVTFLLGETFAFSDSLSTVIEAGLNLVFYLSETVTFTGEASVPLTIIDQFFNALMWGAGAWIILVVILAIALVVTKYVKFGSLPFVFILIFLGVEYLNNVSQASNFIYATVIAWACIPILLIIEYKRKR